MDEKSRNYMHWGRLAKLHEGKPEASWGDYNMIDLEVEAIGKEINENDAVLDAGCGNGHATKRQLRNNPCVIDGVDFCAEMIAQARRWNSDQRIDYLVGDVRKLDMVDNCFDIVYTTRTLINLPTWEEQQQGIEECLRVCKPGGKVVLCEAFWEPLQKLNAVRALFDLDPLVEHDFNRYLKINRLNDWLNTRDVEFLRWDISSLYYFGSRVLRDLYSDGTTCKGYDYPINDIFHKLQKTFFKKVSSLGVGIQQKYVIRKGGK